VNQDDFPVEQQTKVDVLMDVSAVNEAEPSDLAR
jgi:hypothetical protein